MTAPLPRKLMRDTISVKVPKDSPYGGEFENPVTIERVCYQSVASVRATDYQLQAPLKGMLFIDPVLSVGAFEIPAGSLVCVNGEKSWATVHECEAISSYSGLHHWEVLLK